jgi:hypothetical protein
MPAGRVNDPADWRGPDIQSSADWIHQLDAADLGDLDTALARAERKGIELACITKDRFPLPHLSTKLDVIRRDLIEGRGFVLLRGLPLERYSRQQATTIYWGIGRHLGTPVPTNNSAHLISHVVDLGRTFANPTDEATYSNDTFQYHTDECDFVGLLCLHPSKSGGASTLASAVAIHNAIQAERPDLLRVLYEPFYIDRRGAVPEGAKGYQMPVFTWHAGRLIVWLQPGRTASAQRFDEVPRLTPLQLEAQKLVQTLADDPRFRLDMTFGTGDMQFLNNHVLVHSRTATKIGPSRSVAAICCD